MGPNDIGTAPLWCEQCGEQEQEVKFAEAGLCGNCAGVLFSAAIGKTLLPYIICGRPIFHEGVITRICAEPHGTEHDHDRG